eukprot:3252813-Pyramimonas_sp.AAC.1
MFELLAISPRVHGRDKGAVWDDPSFRAPSSRCGRRKPPSGLKNPSPDSGGRRGCGNAPGRG